MKNYLVLHYFVSVIFFAQDKAPNYVAANYTKKKCISRCGMELSSLLVFILQRIFQKVSYYNAGLYDCAPWSRSIQRGIS
jgi:hypothetical protein